MVGTFPRFPPLVGGLAWCRTHSPVASQEKTPTMTLRSDLVVVAAIAAGGVLGLLVGLLVGDARTSGAVGAMMGLVVGCSLTVLPPWAKRASASPDRRPEG